MSAPETASAAGESALVLLSGGQDSATCLAWALARYDVVETVGFLYGQRHWAELDGRLLIREGLAAIGGWRGHLGPDHLVVITSGMTAVGETALTGPQGIKVAASGLPYTFVPGRDLLFFTCCRGDCRPPRSAAAGRPDVRDRLFRLPRLPGRCLEGYADRPQSRHGGRVRHQSPVCCGSTRRPLGSLPAISGASRRFR